MNPLTKISLPASVKAHNRDLLGKIRLECSHRYGVYMNSPHPMSHIFRRMQGVLKYRDVDNHNSLELEESVGCLGSSEIFRGLADSRYCNFLFVRWLIIRRSLGRGHSPALSDLSC